MTQLIIPLNRISIFDDGYGRIELSAFALDVEKDWYRVKRKVPDNVQLTWQNHPIVLGKAHPCFPDRECTKLELNPLAVWWMYEAKFEVVTYIFHPITQVAEKQYGVVRGSFIS